MALAKDQITLINVNDGYVGNDGKTYILNILGGQRSITYNEVGASPSPSPSAFTFELLIDGVSVAPTSISWSATGHLKGTSTAATFTPAYTTKFNSSHSNAINLTVVYGDISIKATAPIAVTRVGEVRYTWIKYADTVEGEGISDSPVGKKYIGIAANKSVSTESSNPEDYTWSLFEGPQGPQGYTPVKGTDYFDGKDGLDGTSSYLWVRYSQNANGSEMTTDPTDAKYIGTATTTTETVPAYTKFNWSLIKGADGIQGESGPDGKTSYLHIKYSDNGTSFTANDGEDVGKYIGTYVDFTKEDSTDFSKYTWNRVVGKDGYTPVKGIDYFDGKDGKDGNDGISKYLHIRYSQTSNGASPTTNPANAKYIGVAVTESNTPPATALYNWTLIKGTDGLPGEDGADGQTSYLHIKYSNDGGTSFTANGGEDVGDWIGTYVDFTKADSTSVSKYTWNKVKGEQGIQGPQGQQGKGISSTVVTYQASTSGTTTPTGAWSGTIPSVAENQYLWTRTVITYTDSKTTTAFSVGKMGAQGPQGETGATGNGISTTKVTYQASSSGTTTPTGTWSTTVPTVSDNQYLWTRVIISYTGGGSTTSYSIGKMGAQGPQGPQGKQGIQGATGSRGPQGDVGVGVSSITEHYLATSADSGVTTATSGWSTTMQPMTTEKKYLWNYETVNFSDGSTSPTIPVIIGVYGNTGKTGNTGATGRSLTGVTEYYLATSAASGVTRTTDGWTTTMQTTDSTKKYLWNYEKLTWSSGTTTTYVDPIIIGIHGAQGPQGPQGPQGQQGKGISSTAVTYQAGSSGTVAPTGTWSGTIPSVSANQYLWTRTVITYTDSKTSTAYAVGKMGAQGPQGNTGPTGNGIDSTKVTYQAGSSGTVAPTGTWQTTVPSVADNQYLWTRIVINYTSGSPTTSYSVGKMGKQGPQGAQGPQGIRGATGKQGPIGNTGTSVSSIVEWYLATSLSSGVTTNTDGWKTTMQPMTTSKKYLWNYEVINFSDGSSSPTIPVIIGVYGNTGATGRALTGITEYYLASASASGVTRPSTDGTSGWTTAMQSTSTSKPYLWNYEKLTWSVTPTTTYVEPIVIGVHGPQGPQGPQGSRGPQGIQGPIGPEGKATYTWIKYADTPTTGMDDFPDGKTYMGIAHNKTTKTESTTYSDYTWSLIKGEQGIEGPSGKDGTPRYTWIKYADDENGSGMNDSPTGKRFLGLAHNKTTATESTKASDYQWSPLYDNVQVGGRNLLANSHIEKTGSREYVKYANLTSIFDEYGEGTYTFSFDLKSEVNGQVQVYQTDSANVRYKYTPTSKMFDLTTEYKRYSFTTYVSLNRPEDTNTSLSFYGTYDTGRIPSIKNVKIEKGNVATDWTPAPEDIEERLVSHDARIDTNERAIALRATTTAVGSIDTRLKAAELKVTADAITSTVRSSTDYINDQGKKVSTNEIISKINQSAEKITIQASKINIEGAVEFSSFDTDLQNNLNKRARTFTSTPVPPYSLGDIWKRTTSTYMCKVARATGSYVAADWEKTGDVTGSNTANDTKKVGGTASATIKAGATAGTAAKTATDRWTYTGKTTINGGQIEADTVTAAQIKANTITANEIATNAITTNKIAANAITANEIAANTITANEIAAKAITANEIAANTITVNQLASNVGSSLDLSSNTAITSRVTSTQMGTALNGKEDSLYKQASAPAHKVGRLWLKTSVTPNVLYRSTGSAWVKATPTTAAEVGAYSAADGSALASRVSTAEQKITPTEIKNTVSAQKNSDGEPYFAQTSEVKQTVDSWTAKFSSIGGRNLLRNSGEEVSSSSYITADYPLTETLKQGEEVTFRMKAVLGGDKTSFRLYNSGGSGTSQILEDYGDGTFGKTFKWNVVGTNSFVRIYAFTSSQTGTSTISWAKLERGSVSTDWGQAPEELYTGVTKIDKDGVEVSRSDSDIKTEMTYTGTKISDAHDTIANFGETTHMPFANIDEVQSEDVVGTVSSAQNYEIGKGKDFTTISEALKAIFSSGSRRFLVNDADINLYINGSIEDNIYLAGLSGNGRIYIRFRTGARLYGSFWIRDCMNRIYIRSVTTTGSGRGMIIPGSYSPFGQSTALWNEASRHVHLINMDINASSKTSGVQGNDSGLTILDSCDVVSATYGTWSRSSHTIRAVNCRGNTRHGHFADNLGIQLIGGNTCISGLLTNVNQTSSTGGLSLTAGTISGTNSGFQPPATSDKEFTQTFRAISLKTKTSTGAWQTYYGDTAAQNRWASTSPYSVGQITFSSDVYSFIADRKTGTTPTIRIRMRRKNTSHGTSNAIKPDPANFSSTAFSSVSGAVQGGWTGWGKLTVSNFSTSGNTLLTVGTGKTDVNYNPYRYYAIWDIAEVEVTKIKNV